VDAVCGAKRTAVTLPLVATATAAATATATTGESTGRLRRRAVAGAIRRAEDGKLNRVLLPRTLRTGNLLRLVQHNLLKMRLAILANVFVYWHLQTSIDFPKQL
jgi:hypothetical protein